MSLTMVSSPNDHSYTSGLSSPPIKIHDFANECATAQAHVTEKPATEHGNSDADVTDDSQQDRVKHQASEVSNDHTDSKANGDANEDANGMVNDVVNVQFNAQVDCNADGHANGHVNGHTNKAVNGKVEGTSSFGAQPEGPLVVNKQKYRHIMAIHSQSRTSCLSHDSTASPSFLGFRNLMVLVLNVLLGLGLYALVPCHLFIAHTIELVAAHHAKRVVGRRKRSEDHSASPPKEVNQKGAWRAIAFAHLINASLCLFITSYTVYNFVHHPLIGTVSQTHALIVWLKNSSYAFTNRDLRHAFLNPKFSAALPEIYSSCPYPRNITLGNLSYFWWAPTLVYQPVYPRSDKIRWDFVLKRLAEAAALTVFIWLASAQYAAPLLRNSLDKIATLDIAHIFERLTKLSTISVLIWLAGFFAVFHSILNALAEVLRFGDREFYSEWWNSPSVGAYWRLWNKPVYHFMKRHIYSPLAGRGWSSGMASIMVFVFSGFLHELLVGIPTHNITGVAFFGMLIQIPMIAVTLPLERMQGINGKIIGNCIFWISFCLVGQPLAALLYFFAWQAKYGSVSKV